MSLIPPKRLFHIPSMSTVMYEDVADDVKEKGYAAISHVWGDQTMYDPDELGIKGGADWKVPLSDPNKMTIILDSMKDYGKEYCWLDVVCMPQDKQNEINLEIPFMGDYYSGADVTFALAKIHYDKESYDYWYDMMTDIMKTKRDFTREERGWIVSYGENNAMLLDISKEIWFERVWTLQETLLSKSVILVSVDSKFDLSETFERILFMWKSNNTFASNLFGSYSVELLKMAKILEEAHGYGRLGLFDAVVSIDRRNCYKQQDKFYGLLGFLRYTDFPVDYDKSVEDINRAIAKYAYKSGDVSWLAVVGNNKGFIQPMYNSPLYIGEYWKQYREYAPGTFDGDTMYLDVWHYATVIACEYFYVEDPTWTDTLNWTVDILKSWNFDPETIVETITSFGPIGDSKKIEELVNCPIGSELFSDMINEVMPETDKMANDIDMSTFAMYSTFTTGGVPAVVAVSSNETGKDFPLLVFGYADIGDEVMMVKGMSDGNARSLGIITSGSERKGVCLYKPVGGLRRQAKKFKQHKYQL